MANQVEWQPIIKELADLINKNGWTEAFEQAITDAKSADVPDLDKINNLNDYLNHINDFLFWMPTENEKGDKVYNEICLFYWIIDQQVLAGLQTAIQPSSVGHPLTELSKWLVDYANQLGAFYDKKESISKETIETFYKSPVYNMDQYERPANDWQTFNEFFARHVKKGLRDPVEPTNPEVIVSAADSVFDGKWPVDDDSNVFFIKGVPWNIESLLQGSEYKDSFKGGTFMHAFLNTTDYHRQHAPIMGTVIEAKIIPGACYLEVVPVSDPTKTNKDGTPARNKFAMRRRLHPGKSDANIIHRHYQGHSSYHNIQPVKAVSAPDHPGYQFLQSRGCVVIDSPIGLVAVLPVGMAQVSSVKLSVSKGDHVEKGQEISCFHFGGSDIVLVFQQGSQVNLTAELEKHYNVGTQIGTAKMPS